ncbi:MAG: hypothetical protein NTU54_06400 [Candidatus Omnitrophica bacterium]|nr:hypothetical protein [Candidatus Omnitrophota bacterium]
MKVKDVRQTLIMGLGTLNIVLLVAAIFLAVQIGLMKNNIIRNDEVLKQTYPGFNPRIIPQLRGEIDYVKAELSEACDLFDPQDNSLRKDYDLSIYFVEELSKANRALKQKASDKQLNFSELNFKEKVPSDREASSMINQLHGLEKAVDLGLDYGVNFKSVEPGVTENLDAIPGIRQQKSQMKIMCPGSSIMDFITGVNQAAPYLSFDSFIFSLKGSYFEADLNVGHTICDRKALDIAQPAEQPKNKTSSPSQAMKELNAKQEDLARILKINNPFMHEGEQKNESKEQPQPSAQQKKEKTDEERFFYHGKAILRSKEVAVIEDTENQETIFVARGDNVGNFTLKDFSEDQAVLGASSPGAKDVVIKRAEE